MDQQDAPTSELPFYPSLQRRSTISTSSILSHSVQSSPRSQREAAELGTLHSTRVRRDLARELTSTSTSNVNQEGVHRNMSAPFSGGGSIQYITAEHRRHQEQPSSSGRMRRRASIAVETPSTSAQTSYSSTSGFPKPLSSPREPGSGGNIRVVVRIRPQSNEERNRDDQLAVHPSKDPSQPIVEVVTQGPRGSVLSRRFNFHCVAGPEDDEAKLLKHMGLPPLLDSALAGYGATIMCYGQTGSGKTHTLFGKGEEAAASVKGDEADGLGRLRTGLVAQGLHYIFATMQKYPGIKYTARVSCLEIHNESIYDLLDDGLLVAIERGMRPKQQSLPVRWDATRGFHVQNLRTIECEDVSSALHVMWRALLARRVGAHELNRESSRSHCMMTLHLEARGIIGGATSTRYGKVAFVDLAGSERLKASKSSGDTLKETTNINKSLLTLGKVVSALSETNNASSTESRLLEKHIPYRDSKLTKLLMDSLGGSCLSCIVACCSPGASAVDETLSTLNYATRAKHIVNKPIPHMDPHEGQIAALKGEIQLLRRENRLLRTHLGISEHVRIVGPPNEKNPIESDSRMISEVSAYSHGTIEEQQFKDKDMSNVKAPAAEEHGEDYGSERPSLNANPISSPRRTSMSEPGDMDNIERNRSAPLPPFPSPLMSNERRGSSAMDGYVPTTDFQEENFFAIPKAELVRRLKDAQNLINEFSAQNERIAHENERLRGSRQMLELDYKCLVNDNEKLQASLANLEDVFINSDDGTAEAFGKMSLKSTSRSKMSDFDGTKPSSSGSSNYN